MTSDLPGAPPRGKALKWIDSRMPIISMLDHTMYHYPTPRNLNYFWNFGSLAGFMLITMIVTGLVLSMHYTAHTEHAFDSVERIMRDVNQGWLLRYLHMNGGSMFFVVVFIHIFRGLYYGSYKPPRELLWWLGVIILLLMMATAFMGYVLPWGQMSFWGAKVITSLFSAIPWVGESITTWLWGGFNVDNPTLNRFYSLHFLLPFVILGVVVLHVWALHTVSSNNPLGIDMKGPQDSIPFHPYYTAKDMYGLGVFLIIYMAFVFYAPNFLGHPDNYIEARPLQTPAHIVPEWYFLPFYAILRAITFDIFWIFNAKFLGVIAMFGSILILFFLPWLDTSKVRSGNFRPAFKVFFWLFVLDCIFLGYLGSKSPDETVFFASWMPIDLGIEMSTWALLGTIWYFGHFLVILPILSRVERTKALPTSISQAVLGGGGAAAAAPAKPMEKA
jgi:quinol-cytochrome oxidoreductase complex cytochrome b subunit